VLRGAIDATATLRFWEKESSKPAFCNTMNTGCLPPTREVFWEEGEAGDYFNELFTDSAQPTSVNRI